MSDDRWIALCCFFMAVFAFAMGNLDVFHDSQYIVFISGALCATNISLGISLWFRNGQGKR